MTTYHIYTGRLNGRYSYALVPEGTYPPESFKHRTTFQAETAEGAKIAIHAWAYARCQWYAGVRWGIAIGIIIFSVIQFAVGLLGRS